MIGFTANELVNHVNAGFGQLIVQLSGACFVAAYSMIISYLLMKFLDKSSDIRITKEQIAAGLDKALLNEQYSDE